VTKNSTQSGTKVFYTLLYVGCVGADPRMSDAQKELIGIIDLVKAKQISQAKADVMFRDWKVKHEGGGQARSFREKQVTRFSDSCCSVTNAIVLSLVSASLSIRISSGALYGACRLDHLSVCVYVCPESVLWQNG